MNNFLRNASLTYAAGSVGGAINGLAVWLFGASAITAALGIKLAPALTSAFLYPRLVWGAFGASCFCYLFFGTHRSGEELCTAWGRPWSSSLSYSRL